MNMYCPICGGLNDEVVTYCRHCGKNIVRHVEVLNDETPTATLVEDELAALATAAVTTNKLEGQQGQATAPDSTIPMTTSGTNPKLAILNELLDGLRRDVRVGVEYTRLPMLPTMQYSAPSQYRRSLEENALTLLSNECQDVLKRTFESMVAFGTYASRYHRNYAEEQMTGTNTIALQNLGPATLLLARQSIEMLEPEIQRLDTR